MASGNEASPPAAAHDGMEGSGLKNSDNQAKSGGYTGGKQTVGMVCEKKDLYQMLDRHHRPTWTDELPDDLVNAAEGKETKKYAFLVRNKKCDDSRKKLEIDSIVMQSPLLKNVLRDVLKDYPGVMTALSRLIFRAPFKPFVHRWQQLVEALSREQDEETKNHLKLLKDVLYDELQDVITATDEYTKNKVVAFEQIWTIFPPGCLVYTIQFGKPAAVRLVSGKFIEDKTLGLCFELKWHDTYQRPRMLPLVYHPDGKDMKEALVARGRLFEMLAGYHYKSYKGQAMKTTPRGHSVIRVDGRIIIDCNAYNNSDTSCQPRLGALDQVQTELRVQIKESDDQWCESSSELSDGMVQQRRPLTEEQLLLCTPIIRGYALREKMWLKFFVDSVSDVVFNNDAFGSLVLPEGHKSLMLAITQTQVRKIHAFDDVIAGKGRGVIILLSGRPGIGKTLTAESVAEYLQVPLYTIGAGDLGLSSDNIETALTRILDMVAKWNAILLLDECDVFLEARSARDLERNRFVSIFLRKLEYYEGLLFLTTNRVKNMDEAFNSRIHFRLAYPDLDEEVRKTVWKGFLDRQQGGHNVSDTDLAKLAKFELNGRVIKNVLKIATLLASHKDEKLGFQHLETILQIHGYKN